MQCANRDYRAAALGRTEEEEEEEESRDAATRRCRRRRRRPTPRCIRMPDRIRIHLRVEPKHGARAPTYTVICAPISMFMHRYISISPRAHVPLSLRHKFASRIKLGSSSFFDDPYFFLLPLSSFPNQRIHILLSRVLISSPSIYLFIFSFPFSCQTGTRIAR